MIKIKNDKIWNKNDENKKIKNKIKNNQINL